MRTGPNSFFTYSGSSANGRLQSLRIEGTNLNVVARWTNLLAGREMDFKSNVIYSADGRTYDATSMQALPAFSGIQSPQSVRAYPQIDRVVFLMSGAIRIYELSTRESLGTISSTNFVWNYPDVPRSIDFAPPDVLYFSSTTVPTIVRTSLLQGLDLSFLNRTENSMEVTFFARTGRTYSIESTDTLPATSWNSELQVTGSNTSIKHTLDLTSGARFFRVRQH